jgi:23S rRNA pseudouridine1911/1915/1917 synthase
VNGEVIRPTRHPRAGDLVTLHWPEPKPAEAQPEDMGLNILFEDESLLVINKLPESVCILPPAMTSIRLSMRCSITAGGN